MFRNIVVAGVAVASLALIVAVSFDVGAKPKAGTKPAKVEQAANAGELKGPVIIDKSFESFQFGITKAQAEEFVKGRVRAYYTAEMAKTKDVRKSDDLLQAMNKRLAEVATDWIVFDGSKAGWNVSIIRSEFKTGMGEEALHVQEGYEHFYYFFTNGVLYKLVRTWESKDFGPVRQALAAAYGNPLFQNRPGDADRRFISELRWHGSNITVDVEDWTESFNSYTVRWADVALDAAVMKSWGESGSDLPRLNPLIDAAKEQPKKNAKDPVDDLLGR